MIILNLPANKSTNVHSWEVQKMTRIRQRDGNQNCCKDKGRRSGQRSICNHSAIFALWDWKGCVQSVRLLMLFLPSLCYHAAHEPAHRSQTPIWSDWIVDVLSSDNSCGTGHVDTPFLFGKACNQNNVLYTISVKNWGGNLCREIHKMCTLLFW